ncbi:MAG: hypothetical protein HQL91_12000 [Magnetococcales bacterium]|nr:hypothetical protein [Magnetococcales bacterium]
MRTDLCANTGIALASLLALSWPAAYFVSRMNVGLGDLIASHHWVDARRHVVSNSPPCASPEQAIKAFRMGIDSDYPLFFRKTAP